MNWNSWTDFWHMGGYAVYVWGSVVMVAALLIMEVWQARHARWQTWTHLQAQHALLSLTDTEV